MPELTQLLIEYSRSGALPMHMPGHKRNLDAFPWLAALGGGLDITEIEGFDDLNDPEGLFHRLELRAARLWGAEESICLVGGSTAGILACVLAGLRGGGELLMCRDSHRSVYHAAQLTGAGTAYLTPARDPYLDIPLSVRPEDVAAALERHPDVRLVCVTSPTYQGVISDIQGIAGVCHSLGVPLLVDEAHGAHLGLPGFPAGAVRRGADMVVQSLHKTLPSLTQTAIIHLNPGLVDPGLVRRCAAMVQSSSPSYILSASMEGCVDYLEREGPAAASRWLEAIGGLLELTSGLRQLRPYKPAGAFGFDPSKLLIPGGGRELSKALRGRYGIEPEYAAPSHVLCMTGMGDSAESLGRLGRAISELDGRVPPPPPTEERGVPRQVMTLAEAASLPGALVPAREALGRVCGEYVWSYPPGVPIIAPGERVEEGTLREMERALNLHSGYKQAPNSIFCVDLP